MSERLTPSNEGVWSHDRQMRELEAEARLADLQDARRARTELQVLYAGRRERAVRIETLELLPEFWDAIYGTGFGYLALMSGSRQSGHLVRPRSMYFSWPGSSLEAAGWAVGESERGREVYQCAHLVNERRRRKTTAAPLASLYVDLDHATLTDAVPQPSVVVESSPGRLQCYWRLAATVEAEAGEQLNRRLAYTLRADKSGWDLTQLLRVPGTLNHKYDTLPLVRVLHITNEVYDAGALTAVLPANEPAALAGSHVRAAPAVAPLDEGTILPRMGAKAWRVWRGEEVKRTTDGRVDRSASLVVIARTLFRAGVTTEQMLSALAERDAALGWRKYSDRQDAAAQYASIVSLVCSE